MIGGAAAAGTGEYALTRAHLVPEGDFEGTVHSVFPAACNIAVGGLLVTVHDAGKQHTPTSVRVVAAASKVWSPAVRTGDRAVCRSGTLSFGPHTLHLRRLPVWSPAPIPRWSQPLSARSRVAYLGRARATHLPAGSAPLTPAFKSATRQLQVTLQQRPPHGGEVDPVVRRLIGAGPGLTPAGDDVLVGLLAALYRGGSAAASASAAFSCLSQTISRYLPRTTDVSAHYLRLATRGFFSEPLTRLIDAVVGDACVEEVHRRMSEVLSVGATSGADALHGVLLGLDVVLSLPVVNEKVA